MTSGEHGPPAGTDVFLDIDVINGFVDSALLPAAETLTGKDFFQISGSEYNVNKRVPLSDGAVRLVMQALVFDVDFCDEREIAAPERVYTITLTREEQDKPHTDALVNLARASGCTDISPTLEADVEAWNITQYYFSNDPNTPPYVDEYVELQDGDGETLWDMSDMQDAEDDDVDILRDGEEKFSEDSADILAEIAEGLEQDSTMSMEDLKGALSILRELGVPAAYIQSLIDSHN